jgi:hypothetical protein
MLGHGQGIGCLGEDGPGLLEKSLALTAVLLKMRKAHQRLLELFQQPQAL